MRDATTKDSSGPEFIPSRIKGHIDLSTELANYLGLLSNMGHPQMRELIGRSPKTTELRTGEHKRIKL